MGVTRERVRQMEERALARLRAMMEEPPPGRLVTPEPSPRRWN
jgi:DNA-directed RNA polymerase sigma subunit (sigma70/sigma32)